MGSTKTYDSNGGFSTQDYKQIGTTSNGIKIIGRMSTGLSSIPMFSNTPDTMYAKTDKKTGEVKQIVVYGNGIDHRSKLKDIDIDHEHGNKINKKYFSRKDIHVHEYDQNGKRSSYARRPSKKERRLIMVARYGKRV